MILNDKPLILCVELRANEMYCMPFNTDVTLKWSQAQTLEAAQFLF